MIISLERYRRLRLLLQQREGEEDKEVEAAEKEGEETEAGEGGRRVSWQDERGGPLPGLGPRQYVQERNRPVRWQDSS